MDVASWRWRMVLRYALGQRDASDARRFRNGIVATRKVQTFLYEATCYCVNLSKRVPVAQRDDGQKPRAESSARDTQQTDFAFIPCPPRYVVRFGPLLYSEQIMDSLKYIMAQIVASISTFLSFATLPVVPVRERLRVPGRKARALDHPERFRWSRLRA